MLFVPHLQHTVYQKHLTYGTSNKGFEPIAEETVEFEKGQTEDNEDRESVKKGEMNSSDKKPAATNPEDDDDDEVAVYKNYLKRLGRVQTHPVREVTQILVPEGPRTN